MSWNISFAPEHLRVEITVPFGETISVYELLHWLKRTSPRAILYVENNSYGGSSSKLSVEEETTSYHKCYLCRAREHIASKALEASLAPNIKRLD